MLIHGRKPIAGKKALLAATLTAGVQPTINPFLFAIRIRAA